MPDSEAEKKFWRSPELVQGLLPFLDPPSILRLGQLHPLTRGVLQGNYNWSSFVRRSCPQPGGSDHFLTESERAVAEMRPIIEILHLIGSPQFHLMKILDTICERFLPLESRTGLSKVKVTCPNDEVHDVSAVGFVLIELVEGANGSSELNIEQVENDYMRGPLISALKSRLARQERVIRKVDCRYFICTTQEDAEALLSLVQQAESVGFQRLSILGAIGEAGWAALVEVLRILPPLVLEVPFPEDPKGFQFLYVRARNLMLDGRREDVRAVWDALPEGSHVQIATGGDRKIFHKGAEEEWVRLEQYLDDGVAI